MNIPLQVANDVSVSLDDQHLSLIYQGKVIFTFPKKSFLQAKNNTSRNLLSNNHYNMIEQETVDTYDIITIDRMQKNGEGTSLFGALGNTGTSQVPFRIDIVAEAGGIKLSIHLDTELTNRICLSLISYADEHFYGFGEQFTHVDLTGMKFPLISGEQGLGRGAEPCTSIIKMRSGACGDAYTTYAPIAVAVTSHHRALFIENTSIMYADIQASDPHTVSFEVWNRSLTMYLWQGTSLLDAIRLHTQVTGRYQRLPSWAHGLIAGIRGGKEQVQQVLSLCEQHSIEVSALWIEDWVGRRGPNYGPPLWWRWKPNEEVYPDFKNWVLQLKTKNIRVMTYFNPFVSDDEQFSQYQEAMRHNYFVRDREGHPYHKKTGMGYGYYMVDLSNPQAFAWFRQIMVDTIKDYSLDGWMADYGEYLSFDCMMANGQTGEAYHQQYALDWIRLNREAVQQAGRMGDFLIFSRCGFSTVNREAICFWEGDQNVTWDEYDGLGSSIVGLLSGGISGIAINHSDIGGHTTLAFPLFSMVRSKELFWRWSELAAFTAVFRTHDGTLQPVNHHFYSEDDTLEYFRLMANLHKCFSEYFLYLENEASEKGYPLIRHTMLHDEGASKYDLRYQFMLGEDIVVFPIWKEGTMSLSGYVPKGAWIDPYTDQIIEGGEYRTFEAPFGKPAFLVRRDGAWGIRLISRLSEFLSREKGSLALFSDVKASDLREYKVGNHA